MIINYKNKVKAEISWKNKSKQRISKTLFKKIKNEDNKILNWVNRNKNRKGIKPWRKID